MRETDDYRIDIRYVPNDLVSPVDDPCCGESKKSDEEPTITV
jgi:hypothetical protein